MKQNNIVCDLAMPIFYIVFDTIEKRITGLNPGEYVKAQKKETGRFIILNWRYNTVSHVATAPGFTSHTLRIVDTLKKIIEGINMGFDGERYALLALAAIVSANRPDINEKARCAFASGRWVRVMTMAAPESLVLPVELGRLFSIMPLWDEETKKNLKKDRCFAEVVQRVAMGQTAAEALYSLTA